MLNRSPTAIVAQFQPTRSRGWRSVRPGLALLSTLILGACGAGGDASPRRIAAERWDTLYVIGTPDVNDTTLGSPIGLLLWGDRLVELDSHAPIVRAFRDGKPLWAVGAEGRGPFEFDSPYSLAVAPNRNLWVVDMGNARITEISEAGEFVREIPLHDLPDPPRAVAVLSDRLMLTTGRVRPHYYELNRQTFALQRARSLPLDEERLPRWPRLEQRMAAAADGETWVSGFHLGPGFFVHRRDSSAFYRYIEASWFVSARPDRDRDTARWAAHDMEIVGEEIFMLYGGRPKWKLHDFEFPVMIDVYGLDGAYRRSYRLPFYSWRIATDGRVFYVTHHDPYPAIFALRPKEAPS